MNNKRRENLKTAMNHIDVAASIIEDIYDENESARDNLPENLSGSALYDRLDEECDTLLDIISGIEDIKDNLEELL